MECVLQTREAFGVFADGADVFWKDAGLRRGGTHHLREPPQMGWTPIGSASVTDIVPEPKGFETQLGVFAIAEGVFTRPGAVTNRFIFPLGDIHGGEISRAGQAGQLHGVAAVGFDPIPWLFGNE
jgi:hypothetical protein